MKFCTGNAARGMVAAAKTDSPPSLPHSRSSVARYSLMGGRKEGRKENLSLARMHWVIRPQTPPGKTAVARMDERTTECS